MSTTRQAATADLQLALRITLGLPARTPLPAERAAAVPHPLPTHVTLDTGAWLAWCLAGLRLFDGPDLPSLRAALLETRRVVTALGMLRHAGNLSRTAPALGTSRKVLRDSLRAAGLYPWTGERVRDTTTTSTLPPYSAVMPSEAQPHVHHQIND